MLSHVLGAGDEAVELEEEEGADDDACMLCTSSEHCQLNRRQEVSCRVAARRAGGQ